MRSPSEVRPPLLWTVRAYDRDWRGTRFVERIIDAASGLGLTGSVEVLTVGDDDRPEAPPSSVSQLSEVLWRQTGPAQFTAAGTTPRPWWLGASFFGAGSDSGPIGRLTLRFSDGTFAEAGRSELLWNAFRDAVGERDVTCAFIDSWDRWLDMRDEGPPLVSQATFEAIFWANFIDAETMSRFNRSRLDLSAGLSAEWLPSGCLYLRLAEALSPSGGGGAAMEERRARLLEIFTRARSARSS